MPPALRHGPPARCRPQRGRSAPVRHAPLPVWNCHRCVPPVFHTVLGYLLPSCPSPCSRLLCTHLKCAVSLSPCFPPAAVLHLFGIRCNTHLYTRGAIMAVRMVGQGRCGWAWAAAVASRVRLCHGWSARAASHAASSALSGDRLKQVAAEEAAQGDADGEGEHEGQRHEHAAGADQRQHGHACKQRRRRAGTLPAATAVLSLREAIPP